MSLDYMKPNKSQDTCFCKGLRWIKQLKRDEFSLSRETWPTSTTSLSLLDAEKTSSETFRGDTSSRTSVAVFPAFQCNTTNAAVVKLVEAQKCFVFFLFFCCSSYGAKEHLLSRDDGPSTGLTQTPVPENIELRSRTFFPPKPGERRFSFQTLDWRELLQLAASLFTFLYLHYIYIFFTKDREVVVCIKGIFFEMALFYMLLLFMMCVVSE